MGPSLLPRPALIAGLLAGVCAALGYGAGAALGWGVRRVRRTPGRGAGLRVSAAVVCLLAVGLLAGRAWQQQVDLAALMGTPPPSPAWPFVAGAVGAGVAALLVVTGRAVRALTRGLAGALAHRIPARAATASAVSVVAVIGVLAVPRVPTAVTVALDPMFRDMNAQTGPGVEQPASPLVSGSPRSAVSWQDLGHDGRDFIGGVPSVAAIEQFAPTARPPIRVYVGVDSSTDPAERARLALSDLDTFGAWDREVLAIGTSTGTGTVDESEVVPLEYMYAGDVATVSTQYSVLPSFLSFLVDGGNAEEAASTLFAAVMQRWRELPKDHRPRLVVFGESLGAYGGDAVFPDLDSLVASTSAALFVGPPNSTSLWAGLTAAREPTTPEWLPVYDEGRQVRWADSPADLDAPPAPWGPSRPVYLQNASDPVVWWSPDLLWSRPDWLAEPRGPDVLPSLTWLPILTFVGLTGDMINSQSVPPGHGHVYGDHPAEAWATMIPPPGWAEADLQRLVAVLDGG